MKNKLAGIFFNGLPWAIAFCLLSLMLCKQFSVDSKNTLYITAITSAAALLVNGLLFARFAKPVKLLESIPLCLNTEEVLLMQVAANHLIEGSLVPGKLALTNKRLIFKPLKSTDDIAQEYNWLVTHLQPQAFYKSIWNAGGDFLLKPSNDFAIAFEVNKIKPWKEAFKPV